MIANITSGKKAAPMILYNENKVKAGKAIKIDSSSDIMALQKGAIDVLDSLSEKTKTENSNIQISLSLAIGEDVDNDTFSKIARDYLELTGFGNCPFVVYRHHDTSHQHIHICTSIMTHNEEKVNMYNNYLTSQKATRELEIKYDLKFVSSFKPKKEVESLKGLREYNDLINNIDQDKANKAQIRKIVAKASTLVLQQYKPTSFVETKKLYKQLGIEIKEVKTDDDKHKGYVFRLNDRPNTPVIKASDLYIAFNERILKRSYDKNTGKKAKANSKRIERALTLVFKSYDSINTEDFEQLLKEKNIVPLFDTYKNGKAYGLSYFDEKTGFIFKSSDVNKEFSFNAIKDRVNDSVETKASISKVLEDNFYKLYNEMRSFGVRTSALNFAKQENTASDLQIALFNEGFKDDKLEIIVENYLIDKIEKLEKSASFVEEKGLIFKALNEYYESNLKEYLDNYDDVTESDYIENQFQEEGTDYFDFIKSSVELKLISDTGIKDTVDDFIENKVKEFRLIPLKEHLKENIKEQFSDLIGEYSSEEKIIYINDNREILSSTIFDLVSASVSENSDLIKYDQDTVNELLQSNINSFLTAQIANAKADIIQTAAGQLISGGLEQRIDKYNFYLLDKSNYAGQILSKLDDSQKELFNPQELKEYVNRFIEKVESVILPFLELNKIVTDKAEERDQFVAYTNTMEEVGPKLSKFYFHYHEYDYDKYVHLFGKDADKLKTYVVDKAEQLALGKVVNEEITSLIDSLRQDFALRTDFHYTGNLTIDFYNYVLHNRDYIGNVLDQRIQNLEGIPLDKNEKLRELALGDDGRLVKYFDKVYSNYLPMSTANVIIKNTLNTYTNSWKGDLSRKQIAERLLDPNVINQIKSTIEINVKSNEVANRIYDNKDLIEKLENRIGEAINNSHAFYAYEAPRNIMDDAQIIVNSIGQMLQNKPAKDGLNTARNDRRKKKTPD